MAVIESKGDGYSLFNGVKLPSLPEYDKNARPYALVVSVGTMHLLMVSTQPYTWNVSNQRVQYDTHIRDGWNVNTGGVEWNTIQTNYEASAEIVLASWVPLWANYDILNDTDNSVYLAASEPIALDGMNVIEWDGDTEGLELYDSFYRRVCEVTNLDLSKNHIGVRCVYEDGSLTVKNKKFVQRGECYQISMIAAYAETITDNYPYEGLYLFGYDTYYTKLFAYYPIEEPTTGDKTTISFNNKEYSIDTAALSPATSALQSHLSTVMNGAGAVINLGGTAYNIDSAKLTAATNAFVQHLGTIAGDGHKVVVGGIEYGVDSAKVTGAIAELDTVWSGHSEQNVFTFDGNPEGKPKNGFYVKISDKRPDWSTLIKVKGVMYGQSVEISAADLKPIDIDIGAYFTYQDAPIVIIVYLEKSGSSTSELPLGLHVLCDPDTNSYVSYVEFA